MAALAQPFTRHADAFAGDAPHTLGRGFGFFETKRHGNPEFNEFLKTRINEMTGTFADALDNFLWGERPREPARQEPRPTSPFLFSICVNLCSSVAEIK
jgi:hypothetical protein